MARIPCRKFHLVDGMILVAASAAGFALIRLLHQNQFGNGAMKYWNAEASRYALPVVLAWSIALAMIRLRRPRPPFRRLFRQPGMAASTIAVAMTAAWFAPFPIALALRLAHLFDDQVILYAAPILTGAGILGAWGLLWLSRTVRHERGWIDRLGIGLGVCWLILFALSMVDAYTD